MTKPVFVPKLGSILLLFLLMSARALFLGLLFSTGILLTGCQDDSPEFSAENSSPTVALTAADEPPPAQVIEDSEAANLSPVLLVIRAKNYSFEPSEIVVPQGSPVSIELQSIEGNHDLVIPQLGLEIPMTPEGKSSRLHFVPQKVGTFEYHCSVGQHQNWGMTGALVVTPVSSVR